MEKKERLAELVVDYLHGIMKELGVEGTTHIEETPGNMVISLTTNESKGLLAKNGQALYAVEQLLQAKINHHSERFMTCEFDVNRWKENRRKKVEELARSSADKALELNRKVYLDPLPPLERKWVHHALTGRVDIETTSEGKDPRRFVIIKPTSLNS
ncbi:protein jag [Bacillus coahuilensis]|uniref:Jag family protein n=1 Tax=Bacillus coahuilensis TaxID=408580 RepID=UPI000750367D|nr:R3H domain-containing nucleic acid-binding protein [Bacillus coahuilensis]